MEEIIYKIEVEDAGASKAAQNIADSLNKVNQNATQSKGSISGFTNELGKSVPAVGQLTTAFKALIANPVGIVIAAIAAAISVVTAAIKKSEPALDLIENAFTAIGNIADVLINNLKDIGSIMVNLATFNFPAAIEGVKKLTNQIEEAVTQGQMYLELSRELEDATFQYRLANADAENQIKALVIASKNRNLSLQEQTKLLDEALAKEQDLVRQREDLARRDAVIKIKQIAQERDVRQSSEETFDQFVKRLVDTGVLGGELTDKVVALYEKQKAAASESMAFQEKIQNMKDANAEKQIAADEKAEASRIKQIEDEQKLLELQAKKEENNRKQLEEVLPALEAKDKERLDLLEKLLNVEQLRADADEESTREQIKANKELYGSIKQVTASQEAQYRATSMLNQVFAQAGQFIEQIAGKNKALAIAGILIQKAAAVGQIVANTAIANAKAVAVSPITLGQPWVGLNTASAAFSIGALIAEAGKSVSEIGGFAGGGLSGKRITSRDGVPISRSNGDNLLATVRTNEVILNERQQAALGGAATFRKIGVPGFADGGFVSGGIETRSIANQLSSQSILAQIDDTLRNMPRQVVVIEDIEDLASQRVEIKEKATL